ncbi:WD40-repeat-containing domain protein [Blakeslea trispora]|nr:WD40-repeat-containing domain protein [Blakeslea trispora]
MDTSRNTHYSSYPYPPQTRQELSQPSSKEIYQYDAPWQTYALDWCKTPLEKKSFRLAIGSFIEDNNNKLQIISRTDLLDPSLPVDQRNDFTPVAEADSYYPITKVLWEPRKNDARNSDLLATTGDILRIWELVDDPRYGQSNNINSSSRNTSSNRSMQQLVKKAELVNMKQSDFCAPLTSFDWNETDPSLIVTSSIDTTCTVWNVETNQAKTQLIAHDSDVYDVAFMYGSADTFASVGADGSVRLFDLRSLEHSTILYEAQPSPNHHHHRSSSSHANGAGQGETGGTVPLLRLQFSRMNSNLLATFHMDSSIVEILDIRYPSAPVAELNKSHSGSINCLSWSPTEQGQIATGGDDSQVLVWNINQASNDSRPYYQQNTQQRYNHQPPRSVQDPLLAYVADAEVNSITWSKSAPDWIGIGFGKTIQALRV